ncbi:hypothetical protein [Paracoccus broussonetiae]|uniref:DUF4169 family protein n=1 Tax=Paracoccus broussonetiae subsp. drimophilus TaxID=3373869 RepID=A0ABW7LMX0_9RHOB
MTKGPRKPDVVNDREARLKAALRANLARRKTQGRARAAQDESPDQDGPAARAIQDGPMPEDEE